MCSVGFTARRGPETSILEHLQSGGAVAAGGGVRRGQMHSGNYTLAPFQVSETILGGSQDPPLHHQRFSINQLALVCRKQACTWGGYTEKRRGERDDRGEGTRRRSEESGVLNSRKCCSILCSTASHPCSHTQGAGP